MAPLQPPCTSECAMPPCTPPCCQHSPKPSASAPGVCEWVTPKPTPLTLGQPIHRQCLGNAMGTAPLCPLHPFYPLYPLCPVLLFPLEGFHRDWHWECGHTCVCMGTPGTLHTCLCLCVQGSPEQEGSAESSRNVLKICGLRTARVGSETCH